MLHTGHCVIDLGDRTQVVARAPATIVHFADVSDAEIDAYVATGEPLEVAGRVHHRRARRRVRARASRATTTPSSGISLPLLRQMMADLGIAWTDLWKT